MANHKVMSRTRDNKQAKVGREGADTNKADLKRSDAKTNSERYKTQGTIAHIDFTTQSFSIDPIPPYVFEQKKKGVAEKSILFVSTCGDNEDGSASIVAKILTNDCMFSRPKGVGINALMALKNARVKIELEVELVGGENKKKLVPKSLKTVKP